MHCSVIFAIALLSCYCYYYCHSNKSRTVNFTLISLLSMFNSSYMNSLWQISAQTAGGQYIMQTCQWISYESASTNAIWIRNCSAHNEWMASRALCKLAGSRSPADAAAYASASSGRASWSSSYKCNVESEWIEEQSCIPVISSRSDLKRRRVGRFWRWAICMGSFPDPTGPNVL